MAVIEETQPEPDQEEDTGRAMDEELRAISAILRILKKQGDAAPRIVNYVTARFCVQRSLFETGERDRLRRE